jgi:uncharacterized protein (PEP-CTERM system associated)
MEPMRRRQAVEWMAHVTAWRYRTRCVGLAVLPGLLLAGTALSQPLPGTSGFSLDERYQGTARASPGFGGLDAFAYPFGTGAPVAAEGPPRAWSITPSIGVELIATDNANLGFGSRRSELIGRLIPGIDAQAELARLTGRLSYSPSLLYYARGGRSEINHAFSGQALATIVEELLFLDVRGFGGVQALGGGFTPGSATVTDRDNQVQTASFQVSPYVLHRFGDIATAQAGYTYGYTTQSGQTAFLPGSTQPFFTDQETTTHTLFGVLRSGPAFGRVAGTLSLNATEFEGTGILAGGHRRVGSLEVAYAVTRQVALLVEGGYEDLRFGGTNPIDISGPIWSVGVRLNPGPNSQVILRYGRRDGFNSFRLDAGVDVGVRTRLFATYNEQLGSSGLLASDLLSSAAVDRDGNFVSPNSGAPLVSPFGGSLLATQSSIQRVKRGTLGASQFFERDVVTLLLSYDERTPVTAATGTQAFAQEGWSAGLSWARQLTPTLTGNLAGQYGRNDSPTVGGGNVYSLRAGLTQEFRPSLIGYLQYIHVNSQAGLISRRSPQNTLVLGLRQTF